MPPKHATGWGENLVGLEDLIRRLVAEEMDARTVI